MTSKFTCDVRHGSSCEDTSKSTLRGKEHSIHEKRETEILRSRKKQGRQGGGEGGENRWGEVQSLRLISNSRLQLISLSWLKLTVTKCSDNLTQPTFLFCPHHFLHNSAQARGTTSVNCYVMQQGHPENSTLLVPTSHVTKLGARGGVPVIHHYYEHSLYTETKRSGCLVSLSQPELMVIQYSDLDNWIQPTFPSCGHQSLATLF